MVLLLTQCSQDSTLAFHIFWPPSNIPRSALELADYFARYIRHQRIQSLFFPQQNNSLSQARAQTPMQILPSPVWRETAITIYLSALIQADLLGQKLRFDVNLTYSWGAASNLN